jgi:aspartate carbamoyltransferase regulatory subunit
MLNISGIENGIVLDHIPAGMSMELYRYLGLDKFDCQVAIIKNATSQKMGKKDIIKISGSLEQIDLDVIGFLDHNITVNIIKDNNVVEKKVLHLPKQLTNVIKCKNPRCITSIEQELPHVFLLTDPENITYRCKYCEEKYRKKK